MRAEHMAGVALGLGLTACVSTYTVPGLEAREDTIQQLDAGAQKLGCKTSQELERGEQSHDWNVQWVYNTLFASCDGQGVTFHQTRQAFSDVAEVYVSNCEAPCRELVDRIVRAAGLGLGAVAADNTAPPASPPGPPVTVTAAAEPPAAAVPASAPPAPPTSAARTGLCKFTSGDFVREDVTEGDGTRYVAGVEQGRVSLVHFQDGSTELPIVGPAKQSEDETLPMLSEGQPLTVMVFDEIQQAYSSVQLVLRGNVIEATHPWPAANKTRYTLTCEWD